MAPIRPTPRFFDGPGPDATPSNPNLPNDQTADGEYLGHLARLPFGAPRPLVGAAERLNLTKPTTTRVDKRPTLAWQTQAWQSFEAIGEVHYAFSLLGAVMSRVNLYVGVVTQADQPPAHIDDYLAQLHENEAPANPAASPAPSRTGRTTNPSPPSRTEQTLDVARSLLDQLTLNIQGGVGGMLRQMGTNLSVAGEMYLVQTPSPGSGPGAAATDANTNPQWAIASTDELVRKGDHYALRPSRVESTTSPKARDIPLAADAFVARIWRSHPRWSREPDSSMLGVLDSCEQLIILQQALRSITRSRMAAGIIFIPEGITSFTSDDGQDSVEEAITRAAMTAVEDEASQTTVVPLVLKGPPDLGERIKWIPLGRQVDDNLVSLIDRTLERIMQGIDIPKDVVSGLANVRYSNAIVIDDNLYRSHIEPLVLLVTDALTSVYLRPLLVKALNSAPPPPLPPPAPANPTTAAPLPPTPATPTGPAPVPATTTAPANGNGNGRPAPTLPPSTTPPNVVDRSAATPQITVADLADPDHLINRVVIWADTSQVVTRPDRSQAANDGYDKRLLSADAWRAARGFTDSDAPTADELLQRLVLDRGQLSPDLVQTLLALVDPAFFAAQNQEAAKGLPSDISTLLLPGTSAPSGPPGPGPGSTPETTAAERAVETTPDALRRRRDQAASTVESRTPGGVGGTPTPPGGSPAPIPKP